MKRSGGRAFSKEATLLEEEQRVGEKKRIIVRKRVKNSIFCILKQAKRTLSPHPLSGHYFKVSAHYHSTRTHSLKAVLTDSHFCNNKHFGYILVDIYISTIDRDRLKKNTKFQYLIFQAKIIRRKEKVWFDCCFGCALDGCWLVGLMDGWMGCNWLLGIRHALNRKVAVDGGCT